MDFFSCFVALRQWERLTANAGECGRIRIMTSRRILVPALPLVFVVVVLGAFTRLSDAGLGCPDWPACYGQLVGVPDPQTAQLRHPDAPLDPEKAWIEVIHRYAAAVLGLVVLAALVVALRNRESNRATVVTLALLVAAQAMLGALTVTEKLQPAIVVAHLIGGMSILFLITLIASAPTPPNQKPHPNQKPSTLRRWGILAVVALAIQIALGGWVSANYAGIACGPQFPQCQNTLVPPNFTLSGFTAARENPQLNPLPQNQLASIHFTHRAFAVVAVLALLVFAFKTWQTGNPRAAQILTALLALQVFLGIASAVLNLPLWAALGHNAVAAALTAALAHNLSNSHSHPSSQPSQPSPNPSQ